MTRFWLVIVLVFGVLSVNAVAQQTDGWRTQVQTAPAVRPAIPGPTPFPAYAPYGQQRSGSEYQQAIAAIKNAESEADKGKAVETLRGLLDEQYDKSLEDYDKYLVEMKKKIEKLREQLDRRRDAKMEMVDLRLKMLVSEAEGLGWPDERPSGYFRMPGQTVNTLFTVPAQSGVASPLAEPAQVDVPPEPNRGR